MIVPTPDFDPLFAEDQVPFQVKMWNYILREFHDMLPKETGPAPEGSRAGEVALEPSSPAESQPRRAA
jgi:hypothetical protein